MFFYVSLFYPFPLPNYWRVHGFKTSTGLDGACMCWQVLRAAVSGSWKSLGGCPNGNLDGGNSNVFSKLPLAMRYSGFFRGPLS